VKFTARQGFDGGWRIGVEWPRSRHRYGGCSLLPHVFETKAEAEAVADDMNERRGGDPDPR
jgi:hypothetical protein